MKQIIALILSCLLLVSLCACAGNETPTESTPADSSAPSTEQTQPTQTTSASADTTEAAQDPTDPKALANSCLEKSVEDLYELIGQPQSSDYAPSCLGPGEDGMLYYDGFIVYTYRENGVETVDYVE